MEEITLALVFTTAGAGVVGGFIAGVVQAVKPLTPDSWAHGRAPMLMALGLSALVVLLAFWQAGTGFGPDLIFGFLLMTYTVYASAIGSHQTVSKIAAVATKSTDPTGPDEQAAEEVVIRDTDTP